MGTLDAQLVAVDARSGRPLWNDEGCRVCARLLRQPWRRSSVKDKVIVGVGGGEYGIRGFIAAYDAATGKEVWRFNTVPGSRRAGLRDVERRRLEDRRRLDLGDRHRTIPRST